MASPCDCDGEKVCGFHVIQIENRIHKAKTDAMEDFMHPAQMEKLGRGTVTATTDPAYYDANPLFTIDRVVGRTKQEIEQRIARLGEERKLMYGYLSSKMVNRDWHGCQDAASDIRDIDSELLGLKWVLGADLA
jgi:hypothetical protein